MTFERHAISILLGNRSAGWTVKRKSGKAMLNLGEHVKVIHFNVGSGYVSYLEEVAPGGKPRVRGILLGKGKEAKREG